MRKCANILSYMGRPLVTYDFAPNPSEFLYLYGKFIFSFISVQSTLLTITSERSLGAPIPHSIDQKQKPKNKLNVGAKIRISYIFDDGGTLTTFSVIGKSVPRFF
jgi:hypothetical protein